MSDDDFWTDLRQRYVDAGVDLERISGILQRTGTRVPYDRPRIFRTYGRGEQSGALGVGRMERLEVWAGFDVSVFLNGHIWYGPDGVSSVEGNHFWKNAQEYTPDELLILARGAALTVPLRTLRLLRRGVSAEMLTALPLVGMSEDEYMDAMELIGDLSPAWVEEVVGFFDKPDMATQIIETRRFRDLAALFKDDVPVEYARAIFNP